VRPVYVGVVDKGLDQLPQVALVQDDDVVEKSLADGPGKSLRESILPWALEAGARWFDEHRADRRSQPGREDGAAAEDHEAGCRLEREGLAKLLRAPACRRARRDGAADHVAPAAADDEKHMKDTKHLGGRREEVHRGDADPVVQEERRPGGVRSRCARQGAQVSGDAVLGDIEAEAKQFPVDAGCVPRVLGGHPLDERSDLQRHGSKQADEGLPSEGHARRDRTGDLASGARAR
jgi:hypothetical protein